MAMAPCAVSSSLTFPARPSVIRPRASASSVVVRAKAAEGAVAAVAGGSGAKWWAPLLGWSGRADYLEAAPSSAPVAVPAAREDLATGRRVSGGLLTEEKARELRARTTECFHGASMYHSAIADRLARPS